MTKTPNLYGGDDADHVDEADRPVFHRLVNELTKAGVPFKHLRHAPVFTSTEAAAARGTALHSGAKALIVKTTRGFHMAVMPADLALDGNALRRFLKSKRLRFASKEEVTTLTGLTPGSIPPFGSLFGLQTICDRRLADNEHINFNAGSHSDSLRISYAAYVAYESPVMASVTRPNR